MTHITIPSPRIGETGKEELRDNAGMAERRYFYYLNGDEADIAWDTGWQPFDPPKTTTDLQAELNATKTNADAQLAQL